MINGLIRQRQTNPILICTRTYGLKTELRERESRERERESNQPSCLKILTNNYFSVPETMKIKHIGRKIFTI